MVRLRAPHSVVSFSHEGKNHEVDESRTIEVDTEHAAAAARTHGFTDMHVAPPVDEHVRIRRSDVLEILESLGVTITNAAMSAEQLVEALKEACLAKLDIPASQNSEPKESAKQVDAIVDDADIEDIAAQIAALEAEEASKTSAEKSPETEKGKPKPSEQKKSK
jgi:hypothetical protein